MRIVGIFTLLGSVLFSNLGFASTAGFEFKPWHDCSVQMLCETINPKEWTDSEKIFLNNTLNFFDQNGLDSFLSEIQNLGFKNFERSEHWYDLVFNPITVFSYETKESTHAITLDSDKKIVIMDPFFNSPVKKDPLSKANMESITLLHELAHAYDTQARFSSTPEFLDLAGFQMKKDSNFNIMVFAKSSEADLKNLRTKTTALYGKKQFLKLHQLERNYGIKRGLPRYYSTVNPGEAFADIVSFIYFDKHAADYMKAELIEYIDTNVLKGARAY